MKIKKVDLISQGPKGYIIDKKIAICWPLQMLSGSFDYYANVQEPLGYFLFSYHGFSLDSL